ncbi:MAG TPA: PBP1A family penicillin-binding protein [Pseudogracilibacillus sp.]|nr:PBP1A family penicillin-binding protein [Pseudogracilibacillus sp.]
MNGQRIFFTLIYFFFVIAFIGGAFLVILYSLGAPTIAHDKDITIVDQTGLVISEEAQVINDIKEVPHYLLEGVILAEDQHFYDHFGIDLRGIARALLRNMESGQLKEGASTISQQLARNLYLSHEKTWSRKAKELYYTIRLEMFYSKEQLLTAYLNTIYFGHGAYGISEASQFYFGKQVDDLSLAEATMLIGIPKGPTYYSPYNNIENATERQHFILKKLLHKKLISEADFYQAMGENLAFKEEAEARASSVDYFIDYVFAEALEQLSFTKESLLAKNATIHTTLDYGLQEASEVRLGREGLDESDLEIGIISLDQTSGAIRQMIGGSDYVASPYNRAVYSKRMVGSTFKPFLYYAALEHNFTATTMLTSEPTAFMIDEDVYEPSNYNGYYAYKPITLAQALALSDNIYAVKTQLFLGADVVVDTTKQLGITTDLPEVASLALGSASIPLLEMTQAYAVLANGGYEVAPFAIEKITSEDGKILYERKKARPRQLLDQGKSFLLTHLMTGMFDRRLNGYMEVTGSSIIDDLHHEYAGKSGTTNSDSWMIGYSPKLVTGVWTGYDDNRPLTRTSDKALAKQTWASIMQDYHADEEERLSFPQPENIIGKVIDVESGLLATENCTITRMTYFEAGTEPTVHCSNHIAKDDEEKLIEDHDNQSFLKKVFDLLP